MIEFALNPITEAVALRFSIGSETRWCNLSNDVRCGKIFKRDHSSLVRELQFKI
jgi:hypothetical protein